MRLRLGFSSEQRKTVVNVLFITKIRYYGGLSSIVLLQAEKILASTQFFSSPVTAP